MTTSGITTPVIPTDWLKRRLDLLKDVSTGRIFTPEEAKIELDVDLEPDWTVRVVKFESAESGFAFVQITPEGWELFPDDTQISPEGWSFTNIIRGDEGEVLEYQATSPEGQVFTKDELEEASLSELDLYKRLREQDIAGTLPEARREEFEALRERALAQPEAAPTLPVVREDMAAVLEKIYPEMFVPEDSFGLTPEESQGIAALAVRDFAQQDPEGFIADLFERGASEEDVRVILEQMGAPGEFTEAAIGRISFVRVEQAFNKVFPTVANVDQALTWIQQDAENERNFLLRVRQIGRNEDTENLLRALYPGQEDEIFGRVFPEAPEIITLSEQQIDEMREVLLSEKGMSAEDFESSVGITIQEYSVANLEGNISGRGFTKPGERLESIKTPEGVVVKIEGKATSTWERFGETVISAAGAPLFTIAGVGISAADIAALALIAFGVTEAGRIGWNKLLDRVLKKPGDLNFLGRRLTEAGLNRNLNLLERQRGVKIPAATRKAFIDKYLEDMAASWARNVAGQGKTITPQALQIASQDAYAATANAVNKEVGVLIPRGTQTGALALGGLPLEPTIQSIAAKIAAQQPLTSVEEQFRVNNAQAIEDALATRVPPEVPPTAVVPTVPPPAVTPVPEVTPTEVEAVSVRVSEMEREVSGLRDWLSTEPAAELVDLIKKTGWHKGEISNLTIAQYRKLTGKEPLANILTADKKHVRWEFALDDIATEMGFASGDALKAEIERAGGTLVRIKDLEAEIRVTEVPVVTPKAVVPAPKPTMIQELGQIFTGIETEVKATQAAIKGLKGEEARIGRETLKGLERELTFVKDTLAGFRQRPDLPEATVLRSTIMAWAKMKGLPKTQLQQIFKDIAGKRQLRMIPQEQLVKVLDAVKAARPKTIRGKTVITQKTETKIQTLKDTLITNKQLTDKSYKHLMEQLGLKTDKYESQFRFITEGEGKSLIRAMNDEAVLAEWDIAVEESLARNPEIKTAVDRLNTRSIKEDEVTFDGKPIKISRGNELRSMRYYVLRLQKELNAPVYDVWQKINMKHLAMRQKQDILYRKLEQSTTEFRAIVNDDAALQRVEDWIAAKHKMATIKSPADITAEEIKLAQELERQFFMFREDVRFARFMEAYAGHGGDTAGIKLEIPDAPARALRRAIDIYEGKGAKALKTFLDTQEWGVIKTGYDPRSFIKPRLHLYPAAPTTFSKGHIQARSGVEYYPEDRHILSRYRSYIKQMMGLTELSPLVRAFDRVFTEHAGKLADYKPVARVLSRGMNEMKGYREDGGAIIYGIERMYAQVAAVVFWRPDLSLRNKFQNFAFNSDYWAGRFFDPRNKALSEQRKLWFETYVAQQRGIEQDYLLYGLEPFRGFQRITRLARKTSLYPWSDKSNRAEAFYVRINRVDRALASYEKHGDVDKLIKDSGLQEFEPRQQAEALELLAMDIVDYGIEGLAPVTGKEAFALYNAQQLVNNVHFLYDRAQRAPAEMGAAGKTLGNILVFNRSWGERLLLQAAKASDPKVGYRERIHALKIVIGIMVAGLTAGATYKKITGKTHNPYNPLNILSWTPGGLAVGVVEDISNTIYWMTQAVQGDRSALGKLPGLFSGAATLTLPFYKNFIQAVDSVTDMKNIDVWAMRKIREMIDEEYEVRGGTHEVERTLLEAFQHALTAGKDKPDTPQEKLADAEEILGQTIEEEDLPYTIQEPDVFDMKNLNTVMGRNIEDISLEDITSANDYSELARAWKVKELTEGVYNRLPDQSLYKIEDFEELYAQWLLVKGLPDWEKDYPKANLGNFLRRDLELLRQYHDLEGAEQKAFLEKHPGLKLNPANEWLKVHPTENAQLAIWGQAKILSTEAYDEFNKLVKELDIPDDAIPALTLPPEGSVENYFKYLETGDDLGYNSWEVQLLIAQDDDLREFLERQPIETPVASLELKVKHRPLFEEYDAYGDKDSSLFIEDADEREEAREKLKSDNPQWNDDMRRIQAIENDGADFVEQWVERGRITDEFTAGSSEAMVFLLDNPETFKWALEQEILSDDGSDWNEPVLRINAKWRPQDEEYDAIEDPNDRIQTALRDAYLDANPEYRMDRRRREAYGAIGLKEETFTDEQVENFVDYWELPVKGKRQERFLIDNPEFAKAMHTIAGIDIPKPADVPAVQFDDIYDKWQPDFDKLEGLSDNKSEHYIEDPAQRDRARDTMRFNTDGTYTEFGLAEIRRNAYGKLVPEGHIENFVGYYTIIGEGKPEEYPENTPWWEDDWFLIENEAFYIKVYKGILENEERDFSKVPTRAIGAKYIRYKSLKTQLERDQYRIDNPDLDRWGVSIGIWAITMSDRRKALGITASERFQEGLEQDPEELKKKLEELERESEIE